MNILVLFEIWKTKAFTILFLAGFLTSIARWFEVFLFSVIAWKLTGNASLAALLIMLRLLGVALTGVTFSFAGAFVVRKKVVLGASLICSLCSLLVFVYSQTGSNINVFLLALLSAMSGSLWSIDFSFRRPMLADALPEDLISAGVSLDVLSSHATRILGPLFGGIFLTYFDLSTGIFFLFLLYALSAFLVSTQKRDNLTTNASTYTQSLIKVIGQTKNNVNLLSVISLTFVFNIFALPFIALISLLLIEKFNPNELYIGMFTSLEGIGALLGGTAITVIVINRKLISFISYLAIILLSISLAASSETIFVYLLAIIIFGMATACYSALQSTIIYINSTSELRSSTFSLLTIAIGCGALGSLNIYLMSDFFSTEKISHIMAIEGLIVGLLFIIIALARFPISEFFEKQH
ncbi:MFS transporter [Paracoccaceae bacterium]|nr:MFS transporter [Paracoccaceae bacterium]